MWAVKNNMKSYIDQDKIKEFLDDGYQIYNDEMELLDNPEEYAVETLRVEGEWRFNG